MDGDDFLELCNSAIEQVRTVVDIATSAASEPVPKSTAWREYFASVEVRPDGTAWGHEVVRRGNSTAALAIMAAAQFIAALQQLLRRGQPVAAFGFEAMSRCVIEACARAWWIYDPAIGTRERVARAKTVQLHSLGEGMKAEVLAGRGTTEFLQARDRLVQEAQDLGLAVDWSNHNPPRPIGFEGQRRQDGTTAIHEMLADLRLGGAAALAYPLYSAVAHATSYGLMRHLQILKTNGSVATVQPQVTATEMGNAVVFAVSSYLGVMERKALLFGFDPNPYEQTRFRVCGEIVTATVAVTPTPHGSAAS